MSTTEVKRHNASDNPPCSGRCGDPIAEVAPAGGPADGPAGPFSTNLVWDRLIEKARLFGHRMTGTWMHVGAPDDLAEAEAFLRDL